MSSGGTPHGVTLREATPDDYPAAVALLLAAYDEFRPLMPVDLWGRYAADMANVAGRAATSILILAEAEGKLAGAVTFVPGPAGATHASLRLLGVHPEARGRGIAHVLMGECVRRARELGHTQLELHTTSFMAAAQALYRAMGFRPAPAKDLHFGALTLLAFEREVSGNPNLDGSADWPGSPLGPSTQR